MRGNLPKEVISNYSHYGQYTFVILSELPIEAFYDTKLQEFYWEQMRKDAERRIPAERKGWRIGDQEHDIRETFFGRYIETEDGDVLWPCTEGEAEVVALRLVVRAHPPEPQTPNQQRQTGDAG